MTKSSFGVALGLVALFACEEKTTADECERIDTDIREAARSRGLPTQGICSSQDPDVQRTFSKACEDLKSCNARCCE